jgi:hypothetical protein
MELIATYEKQYGTLSVDQMCLIGNLLVQLDCEETRMLRFLNEYFQLQK